MDLTSYILKTSNYNLILYNCWVTFKYSIYSCWIFVLLNCRFVKLSFCWFVVLLNRLLSSWRFVELSLVDQSLLNCRLLCGRSSVYSYNAHKFLHFQIILRLTQFGQVCTTSMAFPASTMNVTLSLYGTITSDFISVTFMVFPFQFSRIMTKHIWKRSQVGLE